MVMDSVMKDVTTFEKLVRSRVMDPVLAKTYKNWVEEIGKEIEAGDDACR